MGTFLGIDRELGAAEEELVKRALTLDGVEVTPASTPEATLENLAPLGLSHVVLIGKTAMTGTSLYRTTDTVDIINAGNNFVKLIACNWE